MKTGKGKKVALLLVTMLVITVAGAGLTKAVNRSTEKVEDNFQIVTTTYPMYIATLNITKGIAGVEVVNLLENQSGCLHDYTLTTSDMKKIETADLIVMNGAGMEGFMEEAIAKYPELAVVDSSEGAMLLTNEGETHTHEEDADHTHEEEADHDHEEEADHDHEEEADHDHEEEAEHDHDHGDYNAHLWMNPEDYQVQLKNITEALQKADAEHEALYQANYESYNKKVEHVKEELKELPAFTETKIIIFHDSMEYLAQYLGLDVVYSVDIDAESSLNAGQIAAVIDEVKEEKIKVLFSEVQFEDTIANRIAKETGATVYVLDSLVTGDGDLNSYLNGMEANLAVLKEALCK